MKGLASMSFLQLTGTWQLHCGSDQHKKLAPQTLTPCRNTLLVPGYTARGALLIS